MSTAYYYFAASLPTLEFGDQPSISLKDFVEDCQRLLTAKDFFDLQQALFADESEPVRNATLAKWQQYMVNMRNEAAWIRAMAFDKDPLDYIRGARIVEPEITEALAQAAKSDDPLSIEKIIDEARWQKLNSLREGHYFDFEFIMIYALKLRILERYVTIAEPKGKELFEEYKEKTINEHLSHL